MTAFVRTDVDAELLVADGDPVSIAREQFVHGLLETVNRDGTSEREDRVRAVLARIEAPIRPRRRWAWGVVSATAAMLAVAVLVIVNAHTESSATAMVQASIEASRRAGDRRYSITVTLDNPSAGATIPRATVDVRDPSHFVIDAVSSYGDRIILGRDEQSDWAIKLSGESDRNPPRQLLSQWVSFGPDTLMLVAIDGLLETLANTYELDRGEREQINGAMFDRVSARRAVAAQVGPDRVELWLESRSHEVQRIEMHWVNAQPITPDNRAPAKGGERGAPRGDRGPRAGLPPPPDRRLTPPPLKAVFELIDRPKFENSWFAPETHERR